MFGVFVDHIRTMEMSGTVKSVLLLLVVIVGFILFQIATFVEVNGVFSIRHNLSLWTKEDRTVQNEIIYEGKKVKPGRAKPAIVILDDVKPVVQELPRPTVKLSPTTAAPVLIKKEYHYPGNRKTALVIVAFNRPGYLKRTMTSLINTLSSPLNDVIVDIVLSQDGFLPVLDGVIKEMEDRIHTDLPQFLFSHIHHTQENKPGDSGYHKLARHFGWFLGQMFDEKQYDQVIVLEDDLEMAPDFFSYFDNTAPLLWKDPSLYCVSAWNDNGQDDHVSDRTRVYRSDFFPGLGWMLTKNLWNELGSSWPPAYWDDWLRHPDRRRNRSCIRPEVCRTYTFGEKGTSNAQFYGQYLRSIKLNDQFVDFSKQDMNKLMKEEYDNHWRSLIDHAKAVSSLNEIPPNSPDSFKILYENNSNHGFVYYARLLRLMTDEKAGVWRTAYMKVVAVKYQGTQVYLVPSDGPNFDY